MIFKSRYFEEYYPLCGAVLTAILIPQEWLDLSLCRKLATIYVTIFPCCFGFAFASVAALRNKPLCDKTFIRGMRESGALAGLISYHWSYVRWGALGTVMGVSVGLLPSEWYQPWQGSLFIAVGIGAILSTWRIVSLLAKVIKYTGLTTR